MKICLPCIWSDTSPTALWRLLCTDNDIRPTIRHTIIIWLGSCNKGTCSRLLMSPHSYSDEKWWKLGLLLCNEYWILCCQMFVGQTENSNAFWGINRGQSVYSLRLGQDWEAFRVICRWQVNIKTSQQTKELASASSMLKGWSGPAFPPRYFLVEILWVGPSQSFFLRFFHFFVCNK